MARSDVGYTVRSAAVHVWKTVVTNTPRTLSEVLPALMAQIIDSLASPGAHSCPRNDGVPSLHDSLMIVDTYIKCACLMRN